MPLWNDYKEQAAARGALALELYVITSVPVSGPDAVVAALPDHLAYQRDRELDGQLVMAGPLSDETGEQMQGVGQIVYRAQSMDAARALADADPMHSRGARSYTIRKWLVNEGALTLRVGLSTGKATLA